MERRKLLLGIGIIVGLAAVAVGAWALTGSARRGTALAATVNGEPIYWSQVDAEIGRTAAQFGMDAKGAEFDKQRAEIEKAVLDQLVASRLIMQEARKRNVIATDKEIEEQVASVRQRFPSQNEFESAMSRNGFTASSLRDAIRINVTQRRLADAVASVAVSDAELRKQFDGNRAQYDKPAQVRVSHILFRIGEKDSDTLAQAKAKVVQAKLAEGAKFEDLAQQYSDDPGTARRGGELGFITKDAPLVQEFKDAAFSLKPGQTSGLVKTQFGLHLIRVHEANEAVTAEFDKVKDQVKEQLLSGKREKAFEAWLDGARKAAKVERFARR